ncbi:hypothetical protein BKA80DRAFT_258507 [Phyllosticta citrichinensis]
MEDAKSESRREERPGTVQPSDLDWHEDGKLFRASGGSNYSCKISSGALVRGDDVVVQQPHPLQPSPPTASATHPLTPPHALLELAPIKTPNPPLPAVDPISAVPGSASASVIRSGSCLSTTHPHDAENAKAPLELPPYPCKHVVVSSPFTKSMTIDTRASGTGQSADQPAIQGKGSKFVSDPSKQQRRQHPERVFAHGPCCTTGRARR